MADDVNTGAAYLLALKQTGMSGAGSASDLVANPESPDAGSTPVPGERFQGAEKRRSPRYKCEGSAEMREEGCDVRTWATFTDVSLHGCYVEAQATYPVGTSLIMKLESSGVRFEAKGMVRVSYPYLGMGIAFSEITEENQARLKQLLATLSRPTIIMGPGVVSSTPSAGPMENLPQVKDAAAAIQGMLQFFEVRHLMTREDFLMVLRKSQPNPKR